MHGDCRNQREAVAHFRHCIGNGRVGHARRAHQVGNAVRLEAVGPAQRVVQPTGIFAHCIEFRRIFKEGIGNGKQRCGALQQRDIATGLLGQHQPARVQRGESKWPARAEIDGHRQRLSVAFGVTEILHPEVQVVPVSEPSRGDEMPDLVAALCGRQQAIHRLQRIESSSVGDGVLGLQSRILQLPEMLDPGALQNRIAVGNRRCMVAAQLHVTHPGAFITCGGQCFGGRRIKIAAKVLEGGFKARSKALAAARHRRVGCHHAGVRRDQAGELEHTGQAGLHRAEPAVAGFFDPPVCPVEGDQRCGTAAGADPSAHGCRAFLFGCSIGIGYADDLVDALHRLARGVQGAQRSRLPQRVDGRGGRRGVVRRYAPRPCWRRRKASAHRAGVADLRAADA